MISAGLIYILLLYASAHSGIPIPDNMVLPHVEIVQQFEGYPLGTGGYMAITSRKDGSIGLWPGWKPDDIGQCVLTHELVHYLQFVHHSFGAADVNEPPAYRVEAQCYTDHGLAKEAKDALEVASHFEHLGD